MTSSLSNLVYNLSEGLDKMKCKLEHDDKKFKTVELNISIETAYTSLNRI